MYILIPKTFCFYPQYFIFEFPFYAILVLYYLFLSFCDLEFMLLSHCKNIKIDGEYIIHEPFKKLFDMTNSFTEENQLLLSKIEPKTIVRKF